MLEEQDGNLPGKPAKEVLLQDSNADKPSKKTRTRIIKKSWIIKH